MESKAATSLDNNNYVLNIGRSPFFAPHSGEATPFPCMIPRLWPFVVQLTKRPDARSYLGKCWSILFSRLVLSRSPDSSWRLLARHALCACAAQLESLRTFGRLPA